MMKKLVSLFLALVIVIMAGIASPSYSTAAVSEELQLTAIDDNTVFPESGAPAMLAFDDYYISQSLPENLQSQGQYGTCWAFSSVALAEISLINKGFAGKDIDLSEAQVAYNAYHEIEDELGLFGHDSLTDLGGTWLEDGGNLGITTWSLAAWKGICEESIVPYEGITDDTVLTPEQQRASSAILTNARWFNMSQRDTVKKMIMQYGAVSASMYHHDDYFNSETAAYYQNVTSSTNHAVTIVGWDDNYSASNFNNTPAGDGAWICRNSWGAWWGLDGYCYISYYDKAVSQSNAYAFEFELPGKYDKNYQYDGGVFSGYATIPAGYGYYNNFTATEDETLRAVGIGLYTTDVEYSVMIYDAKTGKQLMDEPVEGCTAETGYYTIQLPDEIELKEGDEFSVYFSFTTASGNIDIMVDTSYSDSQFAYSADNENAKSFFTYKYGSPAYTLDISATYDWCLRIKAYTDVKDESKPGDLDGDGSSNLKDIFVLKSQILGQINITAAADLNGDGRVNIADIYFLRSILLG